MCDCHGSPFNKLRESWSRHYKQDSQGECNCCCQSHDNKPKVKGKFGVAYVIETPTRKCRPCGWEIEFNDTPSKIENNCKMMMKWITCPPLAECQNNDTTLCCCSNNEAINTIQKICRKSADNQNTCRCSRERNKSSSGDCCCKRQQRSCCCDNEIVDQTECCCKKTEKQTNNNCKARRGQKEYFNSKNKCKCGVPRSNEKPCCCHPYKVEENECRCTKTANPQTCCCQSDSESPADDEYCCCRTKANRKKQRRCPCSCNCRACDCSLNNTTKKHGDKEPSKIHNSPTRHDTPHKENPDSHHKPSKNYISPDRTKDKEKSLPRTPYTVSTADVPKKGPDIAGFHDELSKRIHDMNRPQETMGESEIKSLDYDDVKLENSLNEEENDVKDNEEEDDKIQDKSTDLDLEKPKTKKVKAADLLKMIKEEHKKEMEAIHPKLVVKEETPPIEDEEKKQNDNGSDTTLKAESEQTLRAEMP